MSGDILEGSEEVDVNEYGEIVPKGGRRDDRRGVRLKPQTFYERRPG